MKTYLVLSKKRKSSTNEHISSTINTYPVLSKGTHIEYKGRHIQYKGRHIQYKGTHIQYKGTHIQYAGTHI